MTKTLQLPSQLERQLVLSLGLPDEREVHAPQFPAFIELYLQYKARHLSAGTITEYRNVLAPFIQWWEAEAHHHNYTLSLPTFEEFFDWYQLAYYSPKLKGPATVAMCHKTSALLRRVLRWANRRGAIGEDVSELVPLHPYEPKVQYFPTLDEIHALLHAPAGTNRIRDAALLAVMVSTGCRREEAAGIHVDHVHFMVDGKLDPTHDHTGYIYFPVAKRREDGRIACFDTVGGLLLRLWLMYSGIKSGRIFPLTSQRIYDIVLEHAATAGITRIHPHNLRHAFNDNWLEVHSLGGDMADVARRMQLGHQIDRSDINLYHYSNWRFNPRQPERAVERILQFHTSPLLRLHQLGRWQWATWPVIY